jgi:electron transfer flavoprotein alpha/beta subunit
MIVATRPNTNRNRYKILKKRRNQRKTHKSGRKNTQASKRVKSRPAKERAENKKRTKEEKRREERKREEKRRQEAEALLAQYHNTLPRE